MEKSIGKITINNNKKQKTTNKEIKNAKSIRKKHKQKFREECQNNNIEEIIKTKKRLHRKPNIRDDIKGIIEESNTPPNNSLESKWIVIKGKSNIAIGVVYGKQETANKEEIEQQFQELTTETNMMQKNNKAIILGDLNVKWK